MTTLVELLRWRALDQPDRKGYIFLVDGETEEAQLTYGELDRKACAIGARLQDLKTAGERVLLLYPPGLEYIAAFFGCLYAGAVSVPCCPPRLNRPDPRLKAIVEDAQATVVLTTTQILSNVNHRSTHIQELQALRWLATDSLADGLAEEWRDPAASSDTLALLQYTSGSTAAPKGVMVSHANLMHNSALIHQCFEHTPDSVGVIWLPPYHDMGLIGGILQPLYGGFPVVLMSPSAFVQSPIRWLRAISHYRATTSGGPNFAYDLCVQKITIEQRRNLDLSSWDVAFNGAEPVRTETLDRFAVAFEPCGFRRETFYPCYGLAEATLIVSGGRRPAPPVVQRFEVKALEQRRVAEGPPGTDRTQPLVGCGKTLPGQRIVIADDETLVSCLPDQVGEIWVSGPSIARGYWNRPEETKETFHAYLEDTGEGPFLRTGDLGFLKDGELFITGRIKDLIIIRGRNYYPQDIELTVAQSHFALQSGCGAAFSVDVGGEERLVVVQEVKRVHRDADVEEVARAIRQTVAEEHELQVYAVVLVEPASIPRTSSGKIQRRLCRSEFLEGNQRIIGSSFLKTDVLSSSELSIQLGKSLARETLMALSETVARRSCLTRYLRELVAQMLGTPIAKIDIGRPVTSLGIDSLTALELEHRIETCLGVSVPAVIFLEGLSIDQLAKRILDRLENMGDDLLLSPIRPISGTQGLLSLEQKRLWFLDRRSSGNPAYHIIIAVRFTGPLDIAALEWGLGEIVQRHKSLQMVFPIVDGRPVQAIAPSPALALSVTDLRALSEAKREDEARRLLTEKARLPFDLAQGPLVRVTLLRQRDDEHVLAFILHHIISDIWSVGILLKELATLYSAFVTESTASLPDLLIQYTDFAQWQREKLQDGRSEDALCYWKEQLADAPPALVLPTDRPRPVVQSFQSSHFYFDIPATLSRSLREFSREEGVTLYMVLLTAFKTLLHCWTGQRDIVVGSPTSGRVHPETDRLIGLFAYPLVLRTCVSGDPALRELLMQVRQVALSAYAHSDVPFSQVVKAVQPRRSTNYAPLFQVMFGFIKSPLDGVTMPNLELSLVNVEAGATDLDLFLTIIEEKEHLRGMLQYSTDLFDADTIEHLAGFYCDVLKQCIRRPETRLSEIELPRMLAAKMVATGVTEGVCTIAIAATFTAEPVEESLSFWMQKLGLSFEIMFAPYNQLFQQLLNPSSLLSQNDNGVNVVLIRFEDWQRFEGDARKGARVYLEGDEKIERNVRDLIVALKTVIKHSAAPLLVMICPASPDTISDSNRVALFERLEDELVSDLDSVNGVYVVTTAELATLYPVSEYYDSYKDKVGHIPYTPAAFAAFGTMIVRKMAAIKRRPYKVIVLDCDQTLWKGVCGEDGPLGVEVDPPRKALQEFMVAQQDAGMLICLCSKNNEEDVDQVFQHCPDMVLKREHIVSWRINWRPKSENLKSLAKELGLGLNSFIFLDDDPVECAEVQANCPQVLTLLLPQESDSIPQFLNHVWTFDHLKVTAVDRQRTLHYRQNAERERLKRESSTLYDFLASLELAVEISPLVPEQFARVVQLIRRTNQFNITMSRLSEKEIHEICLTGKMECLTIKVRDRFGDYGLVGAMVFKTCLDALWVNTFLLSCRVLGRGVEYRMLACLAETAKARGLDYVLIPYLPTQKNQPALNFLNSIDANCRRSINGTWFFRFSTESIVSACTDKLYSIGTTVKVE